MDKLAKKVLLVGWDGADWKIINKLMDQGLMPAMEYLVNNGSMGNLATLEPPFSPMLWTSIATGMTADKHGILGFTEPTPDQHGVRPVSSLSRKVKAIWNILSQEGYKTNVVGWWPSHPAEPINGVMVSNHYHHVKSSPHSWKMMRGTVHPYELSNLFAHLRVHPYELTQEHILPFVPNAASVDQDKDKRINQVAKLIAECSSIQAASTWIMKNKEWDFMALYLDGIDHFCHSFMNYYPPKMRSVNEKDYNLYNQVVVSVYMYHDMMLKRLIELAGEDATIMVISDHGFHSDHLRPPFISNEPAGPAEQHRDHGIFCLKGPGIKKDEIVYGASLLDITPTLLTLFGLPLGKDMDGLPIIQAFEEDIDIELIPSWEKVKGDSGTHPEELRNDSFESQEALDQLVELGYIEKPGEDMKKNVDKTILETKYNLARVYLGDKRIELAIPLLQELFDKEPEDRFAVRLARAYSSVLKLDKCVEIIEKYRESSKKELEEADSKTWDLKKELEGLKENDEDKLRKEQISTELFRINRKTNGIKNALMRLELLEAELWIKRRKPKKALESYREIQKKKHSPEIYMVLGNAFIKLKYWKDAEESFQKLVEFDSENYIAHHGLAITNLKRKKFEESINESLTAIGLKYDYPLAHYHLGEALVNIKEYEQASSALEVCIKLAPNIGAARNLLIELYEKWLFNYQRAVELREYFSKALDEKTIDYDEPKKIGEFPVFENEIKDIVEGSDSLEKSIIVVSGLPRSGTSMMMQVLQEAGIEIFTDNIREANESNPKGYLEHKAVKSIAKDTSWLREIKGKAVKIVSHLLIHLPPRYTYKVIFMQRDITEIVTSQSKMLEKEGKITGGAYPTSIEIAFKKNLEKAKFWMDRSHNIDVLFVKYKDVLCNPEAELQKIVKFMGIDSDVKQLSNIVDSKLYRVKV